MRYKYLWFFGIFASFTANGEEYDILARNLNTVGDMQKNLERLSGFKENGTLATGWENISSYISENLFTAFLLALAILAVLLLIIWIVTVSQAAIISAAARHEKKKSVNFLDLFWNGHHYFWRIFIVNVYAKIILWGIILIPGIPLAILFLNTNSLSYAVTLSLIAFIMLVPVSIIFSFITKFAASFIVIQDMKAREAFIAAWKLFFKNWLVSLEMALLLFLINFVLSFLVIVILSFLGLPFTFTGTLILTYIVVFIGALLATFQFSSWTLLFLRLIEGKSFSKLTRFMAERGWVPSKEAASRNTKL
ncbi:MAG: hypothetical protein WCV86_01790 [Patescibacteria group bacterium]